MTMHLHRPGPPLDALVACFWLWEGVLDAPLRERVLPKGTVELVINLREDRQQVFGDQGERELRSRGVLVCGPHSRYFVIENQGSMLELGVHFRPGGAYALLGLPLDRIGNLHLGLDSLWGEASAGLRERLVDAPDHATRFARLESALLARLARGPRRHPLVAHALRQFEHLPRHERVGPVIAESGYSARRFIDLFSREVGLTPKAYCRVRRFDRMLGALPSGKVDWARVAADVGCYDQSHLNREFRAFAGLTPTAYAATVQRLGHVPDPG